MVSPGPSERSNSYILVTMIFDSKSLSTKEPDWDDHIVVAGSGPVGIFTAIWLGRNGIKVLLIPGKDASLSEDRNAKK